MRRYLVTGGAGFIGSHLSAALVAQGADVVVLDDLSQGVRERVPAMAEFVEGCVSDIDLLKDLLVDADGCFHLAAITDSACSGRELAAAHRVNQVGTLAVFNAARRTLAAPCPVVWASSAAVYGEKPRDALEESSATLPISPYGVDKFSSEVYARTLAKQYSFNNVALRLFNVFGPGQLHRRCISGVIPNLLNQLSDGHPFIIHGDGHQVRDFVYVSDVVNAFISSMRMIVSGSITGFEIYNVCRGHGISILGLVELISDMLGKDIEIHFETDAPSGVQFSVGDSKKIFTDAGWSSETSLLDGMIATLKEEFPGLLSFRR